MARIESAEALAERSARLAYAEALLRAAVGVERVHTVPTLAECQAAERSALGLSAEGWDAPAEALADLWLESFPEALPEGSAEALDVEPEPSTRAEAVAALEALDASREAARRDYLRSVSEVRRSAPRLAALMLGAEEAAVWGSVSEALEGLGAAALAGHDWGTVAGALDAEPRRTLSPALAALYSADRSGALPAAEASWEAFVRGGSVSEAEATAEGLHLTSSDVERSGWSHDRLPSRKRFVSGGMYPGYAPTRDRRGITSGAFSGVVYTYGGAEVRAALAGLEAEPRLWAYPALSALMLAEVTTPANLTTSVVVKRDVLGRKASTGRKATATTESRRAEARARKAAQRERERAARETASRGAVRDE